RRRQGNRSSAHRAAAAPRPTGRRERRRQVFGPIFPSWPSPEPQLLQQQLILISESAIAKSFLPNSAAATRSVAASTICNKRFNELRRRDDVGLQGEQTEEEVAVGVHEGFRGAFHS